MLFIITSEMKIDESLSFFFSLSFFLAVSAEYSEYWKESCLILVSFLHLLETVCCVKWTFCLTIALSFHILTILLAFFHLHNQILHMDEFRHLWVWTHLKQPVSPVCWTLWHVSILKYNCQDPSHCCVKSKQKCLERTDAEMLFSSMSVSLYASTQIWYRILCCVPH